MLIELRKDKVRTKSPLSMDLSFDTASIVCFSMTAELARLTALLALSTVYSDVPLRAAMSRMFCSTVSTA